MVDIDGLQIKIDVETEKAVAALDKLAKAQERLIKNANTSLGLDKIARQVNELGQNIKGNVDYVERLANALDKFGKSGNRTKADSGKSGTSSKKVDPNASLMDDVYDTNASVTSRIEAPQSSDTLFGNLDVSAVKNAAEQISQAMNSLNGTMQQEASSGGADMVQTLDKVSRSANNASKSLKGTDKATRKLGDSAKRSTGLLGKLGSSIKRILLYRAIRSLLSSITGAFTEGIKNLYQYSAAMNSMDASHAKSTMDGFATTALYVKNSLAAALMPLLNALLPIVNTIANAFVSAANAVNAFLSAIRGGGTYTKAVNKATQYADATSGTASAAKELQRTLMGFDEINRLDNPNTGNGGGSGASALDPSKMFGEFEIPQWILKFVDIVKEKVEPAIDRLKEAFGRLKEAWENFKNSAAGSWLIEFVAGLVGLGGALVIDSLTTLIDALADVLNILAALSEGNWSAALKGLKDLLVDLVFGALTLVAEIIDSIFGTNIAEKLNEWKELIKDGTYSISNLWNLAKENVTKAMDGIKTNISNGLNDIGKNISDWFNNKVKPWFTIEKWRQLGSDAINSIVNGFRSIQIPTFHLDWDIGSASIFGRTFSFSVPKLSFYENGGFPDAGSLFVAGESGAEFVGNVGGSTGVVNEDQMAQSVASGNAQVVQMLAQLIDVVNSKEFASYLDGKKVSDTVTRYQRGAQRATGVA